MSRTRSRRLEGRRWARRLAWALLLACTGCDLLAPEAQPRRTVCQPVRTSWTYNADHSDSTPVYMQLCVTGLPSAQPEDTTP